MREAAEAILARYRVQGLLRLHYKEHVDERPVRRYGARAQPPCGSSREVQVTAEIDQDAVTASQTGWRVYATNHHTAHLTLTQAVGLPQCVPHRAGVWRGSRCRCPPCIWSARMSPA